MPSERQTIDVENSGGTVTLEKPGDDVVNVRVDADASISADLKVSDRKDDASAFTHKSYSSTADVDDTGLTLTERYVTFEVTTGTGTPDETADVLISSAGTHP